MPWTVKRKTIPAFDRFIRKLRRCDNGCWKWCGHVNKQLGYGFFMVKRPAPVLAHRFSFEAFRYPIPTGMTIDHLCRNRWCVNPFHLQVVTIRENILRGTGQSARNAVKTHCKFGHEFTKQNTYLTGTGGRQCRICRRLRFILWSCKTKGNHSKASAAG
jgi:hypothetical protein